MKLVRLLTAGKSLIGVREGSTNFRFERGALPRFGKKGNPFSTEDCGQGGVGESSGSGTAAASSRPAGPQQPAPAPVVGPAAVTVPGPLEFSAAQKPSRGGKLKQSLMAALRRLSVRVEALVPRRRAGARTASIPFRPPEQRELSLDRVKVMRNDLRDSDMEVVPAKPAPGASDGKIPELPGMWEAGKNPFSACDSQPDRQPGSPGPRGDVADPGLGLWPAGEQHAGSNGAGTNDR
jgi:hypothetical protein